MEIVRRALDAFMSGNNEAALAALDPAGRGKGSGVELKETFFQVLTLRSGMVVRWEGFGSRAKALEAAGLSE